MSRHVMRRIREAKTRKDEILRRFAADHYGREVGLADLHPDVKYGLGLLFAIHRAYLAGDSDTTVRLLELVTAYRGRYRDQEDDVTPTPTGQTGLDRESPLRATSIQRDLDKPHG